MQRARAFTSLLPPGDSLGRFGAAPSESTNCHAPNSRDRHCGLAGGGVILRTGGAGAALQSRDVQSIVTKAVRSVMNEYGIPGMAVGVTIDGRHYVFNYGVASKATRKHVDASTLFEIGSITKTFTASLVSYAQVIGELSLSDKVSADFPSLRGTSFDRIRLVNLGTHTAGGLPLQFPDEVLNDDDAIKYYRRWQPSHPAGTYRLYSNPSIMLLGLIAANRMDASFAASMQRELFTPLGLRDTFLLVPADRLSRYAQGYTDADKPRRMFPTPCCRSVRYSDDGARHASLY